MLCGREEEGEEREDGGVWEELELEAERRERREGGRREGREGKMGGRCRGRLVQEQEDRSTAGTDGLLGLRRVLPDKDASCSVLKPQ